MPHVCEAKRSHTLICCFLLKTDEMRPELVKITACVCGGGVGERGGWGWPQCHLGQIAGKLCLEPPPLFIRGHEKNQKLETIMDNEQILRHYRRSIALGKIQLPLGDTQAVAGLLVRKHPCVQMGPVKSPAARTPPILWQTREASLGEIHLPCSLSLLPCHQHDIFLLLKNSCLDFRSG